MLSHEIKEEFIELLCKMEDERITQDGELNLTREEIDYEVKQLKIEWFKLSKKYNVSFSYEEVEEWMFES